jgi:glycosyltransferase involved in cell wall biosynthesis
MKFLFVHQNFPGQFVHIVRHLLAAGEHDVVFITGANGNSIPGVRRVTYQVPPRATASIHSDARDFELAMARAEAVGQAARQVKGLGFEPDIIIGHHGWGELLNLADVWPGAPLLGYHEFYYHLHNQDVGFDPEFPVDARAFSSIRAKNAVNLLALTNPGYGQTPTQFQLDTYPAWSQPSITLLQEGVNLDVCHPDPAHRGTTIAGIRIKPSEKLVTYIARDLEPYRGFHIALRALPALFAERPDARVVMVGGDGASYGARLGRGTWREYFLREVGRGIDMDRLHFPGRIPYTDYVRLLKRSDAHIYLTYPFVASWSLREAMACGCAIVASDTAPVREFITHGKTGVLTPFFEPTTLAERVIEQLEGGPKVERMRAAARKWAETHLRMDDYLRQYERLIEQLTGRRLHSGSRVVAGRKRSTK